MKMKEFGPRGGVPPWRSPLDPPMGKYTVQAPFAPCNSMTCTSKYIFECEKIEDVIPETCTCTCSVNKQNLPGVSQT